MLQCCLRISLAPSSETAFNGLRVLLAFAMMTWKTHGQTAALKELQKSHDMCEHSGAMPSCDDHAGYAFLFP